MNLNYKTIHAKTLISCNGPEASMEVALLLMECLLPPETAQRVRHYMICELGILRKLYGKIPHFRLTILTFCYIDSLIFFTTF
jgi:hypothetical protein